MELLTKVMKYLNVFQAKNLSKLQVCAGDNSLTGGDSLPDEHSEGAKVAAIATALHHHANDDVRAKVAAIAVALHHHEMETAVQNNGSLGLAALVAAIHHHKNIKK